MNLTFTQKLKLLNLWWRIKHEWENIKRVYRGEMAIPYSSVKPGQNFNKRRDK